VIQTVATANIIQSLASAILKIVWHSRRKL